MEAAAAEAAEAAAAEAEAEAAAETAHEGPRPPNSSSRSDSSSPVSVEVDMLERGSPPPPQPSKGRVLSSNSVDEPARSSEAAEMVTEMAALPSQDSPKPCVHARLPAHASDLATPPHAPASSLERCLRCCSPLLA